jgi:hypothetical protein
MDLWVVFVGFWGGAFRRILWSFLAEHSLDLGRFFEAFLVDLFQDF